MEAAARGVLRKRGLGGTAHGLEAVVEVVQAWNAAGRRPGAAA